MQYPDAVPTQRIGPARRHPVAPEAQPSRHTAALLRSRRGDAPQPQPRGTVDRIPVSRQVGATVGAFYSRFESKEAYFNALMALATRDGEQRVSEMAGAAPGDADLATRCRQVVVGGVIGWMRAHEGGVLRAALQHDDNRPDSWSPFKALARANTERAIPLLLPAMGKGRRAAKSRAIAFGFQVVLGTLINAILNDPGPLSLRDKELKGRLSGCLLLLLEAEMKAKS